MKKIVTWFCAILSVCLIGIALTSCEQNGGGNEQNVHTVTFYDQDKTTVLKKVDVNDGEKVESWTPEDKENATFDGWYATPTLNIPFDFDQTITEDKSVFSKWNSLAQDPNTWEIVGNLSGDLISSDWGKGNKDSDIFELDKVEGKPNVFEGTFGLVKGNEFQFAVIEFDESGTPVWKYQMGGGLLDQGDNEWFSSEGNYLDPSAGYKENIIVEQDGLYKFTLTTDLVTPTAGIIEVERVDDFSLDAVFSPFIGGTPAGGANTTNYADLKFSVGKAEGDNIVWTGEFSFNAGELLQIYMVDKDYTVQLSGLKKNIDAENTDSENVNVNSANEIEIINSGKYEVKVTANKNVAKSITEDEIIVNKDTYGNYESYKVAINRIGDYEVTDGVTYDTFNFKYNGNGTDYTVYLRDGAKFPNVKAPTLAENEAIAGWYYEVDGERHGISYNKEVYKTTGATYNVNYEVVSETSKDTRDFKLDGEKIIVDGVKVDWSSGGANPAVSIKQTANYTYEATIVCEAGAQIQIASYYCGIHQGVYLRSHNVVNGDGIIDPTSAQNIKIVNAGTYKLVLNSLTNEITITPVSE